MRKIQYTIYATIACLVMGCSKGNLDMLGMFYTLAETSDERFEQSLQYDDSVGFLTFNLPAESYKLYVMTDIHVDFTTYNLDTFVAAYKTDPEKIPFCLLLGDLINATDHYDTCYAHLAAIWNDGSGDTCLCTLGNHDMYYDQWKVYRQFFPTSTYWFVVQTPSAKDLFICLDSANGTLGKNQRKWLESLLKVKSGEGYRHIIVYTHTHFFKKDNSQGHTSNFAIEETYELADIFARYGVELVLQGHSHHRDLTTFKGVNYLRLDAMEDHYYNAFYTTLQVGETIQWDFIPVGPQKEGVEQERIEEIPY